MPARSRLRDVEDDVVDGRVQRSIRSRQRILDALVELVEERRRGNCVERFFRATAQSYVISPGALGGLAADPEQIQDRSSSSYLAAVTARTLRDLASLRAAGGALPTTSLDLEVRFPSAAHRAAFGRELSRQVSRLAARYGARSGSPFRLVVGSYPIPPDEAEPDL